MDQILKDPNGLTSIMQPGDFCIVDRGFRDVIDKLKAMQNSVLMPALKGNLKQLTTSESNDSRFVTKLRWAVEAIHGIFGEKYLSLAPTSRQQTIAKINVKHSHVF